MVNMMNSTGWGFGLISLWGIHILSVIVFFVGVVLLLIWAFKHLSAEQLWKWGWILVVVGTIVCLLTIGVIGKPWLGLHYRDAGNGNMQMQQMSQMMNMMMKHDEDATDEERGEHMEMRNSLQEIMQESGNRDTMMTR